MKKTLIALMALGTTAMADSITLSTANTSGNYNSNSHGFYLSLSSNEIQIKTPEVTLTDIVALDSMTIKACNGDVSNGVTYGLVVLGGSDNTVLGYTTSTATSAKNVNATFNFSSVSGSDLLLNSADTYRFITVSSDVLTMMADSSMTYVYNAGGTGAATSSVNGQTVTISQGLVAPGTRWYHDAAATADACCAIFAANMSSGKGEYSPILTDISVRSVAESIPEPATATLSLLALAGLAARRRRH